MIIGLIGMAGAGKSRWASRFAAAGWRIIDCDGQIAAKLRSHAEIGAGSVYDLGRWMGFPTENGYNEREAMYLAYENMVLRETLATLRGDTTPTVLDLTGSVVYLDPDLLTAVRQAATLVYLEIAAARHAQLIAEYLQTPRPIVWHGALQPRPGESASETLARCYPQLIALREQRYAALGHITLAEAEYQHATFGVADMLALIERR